MYAAIFNNFFLNLYLYKHPFNLLVGNEPDQYAGSIRPSNWSSLDYTTQFLVRHILHLIKRSTFSFFIYLFFQNWTAILSAELNLPKHIFQSGAFAINPTSSAPMTTVSTIEEGIDSTGVVKLFDQHSYDPFSLPHILRSHIH